MRFMLDTDAISFALRGQGQVAAEIRRRAPSQVCTSSTVVAELELGVARRGSRRLRAEVDAFCRGIVVLSFDGNAAERHGRLAAALLDDGAPIGVEDTMIAAHAISAGCTLVTHNRKHFARVSGLRVEDWL